MGRRLDAVSIEDSISIHQFFISIIVLALSFLSLNTSAREDKVHAFWTWFSKNEAALYAMQPENVEVREALFDRVSEQLEKVDENLTFEFGPPEHGVRDFVISAAGIRSSFPAVEQLARQAPVLPRWKIIAFRPRRSPVNTLTYADITLIPKDVQVALFRDGKKIGLVLYFKSYSEAQKNAYGQAGYLLLDEALGEYDVETKVGYVEFKKLDADTPPDSVRLSELAAFFDQHYKK